MEDINETITNRFIREITLKGWTKEIYNKKMQKSERWITRVKAENREWTISNFMRSCTLLGIVPSSILSFKIRKKPVCDMTIKELIQIMLKENCNHFIEQNPDKITMIMDFIKVMTKEVKV